MALGIVYRPGLYLGDGIKREKLDTIKKKLGKGAFPPGVFLVSLSRNAHDQLEIYDARQLRWRYYEKYPPYVVGLAGNWDEAVRLVAQIAAECQKARGDCALKEYLRC